MDTSGVVTVRLALPPRNYNSQVRVGADPRHALGGAGTAALRCPRFQRLSRERKPRGSVSVKQGQGQETTVSTEDAGINKAVQQLSRELGEPQPPRGFVGNLRI